MVNRYTAIERTLVLEKTQFCHIQQVTNILKLLIGGLKSSYHRFLNTDLQDSRHSPVNVTVLSQPVCIQSLRFLDSYLHSHSSLEGGPPAPILFDISRIYLKTKSVSSINIAKYISRQPRQHIKVNVSPRDHINRISIFFYLFPIFCSLALGLIICHHKTSII